MWETQVWSLGREDPLEKEMATHPSILAWRIPWTEEPGGLQTMGWQGVRHTEWLTLSFSMREMDKMIGWRLSEYRWCLLQVKCLRNLRKPSKEWNDGRWSPFTHLQSCPRKEKKVKLFSRVQLFATPWSVAYQAPPSMGFSRQEYWSGLPFPSPGDLPDPGMEPRSPAFHAEALTSEPPGKSNTTKPRGKNIVLNYIQDRLNRMKQSWV